LTPAGPSRSGQTTRVGAASALAYGGRSKRLCFRGSITQQLHSLCTLRSAGHPTTVQHSVPGGGHLSWAAVETLQGSNERFQFFIHSPLPGFAWRTCRSLSGRTRSFRSVARLVEPEPSAKRGARARARARSSSDPILRRRFGRRTVLTRRPNFRARGRVAPVARGPHRSGRADFRHPALQRGRICCVPY
jgi:hypothetical protein